MSPRVPPTKSFMLENNLGFRLPKTHHRRIASLFRCWARPFELHMFVLACFIDKEASLHTVSQSLWHQGLPLLFEMIVAASSHHADNHKKAAQEQRNPQEIHKCYCFRLLLGKHVYMHLVYIQVFQQSPGLYWLTWPSTFRMGTCKPEVFRWWHSLSATAVVRYRDMSLSGSFSKFKIWHHCELQCLFDKKRARSWKRWLNYGTSGLRRNVGRLELATRAPFKFDRIWSMARCVRSLPILVLEYAESCMVFLCNCTAKVQREESRQQGSRPWWMRTNAGKMHPRVQITNASEQRCRVSSIRQ